MGLCSKREHEKNLPPLLEKTVKEAGTSDVDFIAVTQGPGLEPALWVGIGFAIELGKKWNKPVVPIDHMEGHIYSVLYQDKFSISNSQFPKLELPALALLVSGGHTELVDVKDFGHYEIIGQTLDDAVGEAFDKVARMLGLPYPGGPEISRLANQARNSQFTISNLQFPRPMINSKNFNFSYSGLKTAVLYYLKGKDITNGLKQEVARAFEDAAVEVLIEKTRRALLKLGSSVKTLIVAGGVSGNTYLTGELEKLMSEFPEISLRLPVKSLSTDNAVMIGIAAFIKASRQPEILEQKVEIRASGNLALTV